MEKIPEDFRDLFKDETKAFLHLATIMASDGDQPQVTPVWFNHDNEHILINSAKGRVKDDNMRANPQVSCLILDPNNAYRYIQIMGTVVEITEDGAAEHIKDLALKYRGKREYPLRAGEARVKYKIRPENVSTMG